MSDPCETIWLIFQREMARRAASGAAPGYAPGPKRPATENEQRYFADNLFLKATNRG